MLPTESTQPTPRSARRYRWITLWLVIGCINALLLAANAVRDYLVVSRWLGIQQTRHQMTEITATAEQQLRRTAASEHPLRPAFARSLTPGGFLALRDENGAVLEHLGATVPGDPFTQEEEHAAFQQREPLYRTEDTPTGLIVVEVFAIRSPPRAPQSAGAPLSPDAPHPRPLTLEVGLPLRRADRTVLAPIHRNLAINLTGALSLLATVVLASFGLRSYAKGQQLEEQVGLAREVQARLLPDPAAQTPGLQLATIYYPSDQVGGDFYDLFADPLLGFALVIGDVSGKGLPAALLMGVIHGAVRTAPWQYTETSHEEESRRLNRLLCERASSNRFASLFWCVYGRDRGILRFVNAGHCPPFLLRRSGDGILTERLHQGGPVLGLLPNAGYTATSVPVAPGDLLVLYSDGLIEASNAAGEEFGEARLEALLRAHIDDPLPDLRSTVLHAWQSFSPPPAIQDDLTLVLLRF